MRYHKKPDTDKGALMLMEFNRMMQRATERCTHIAGSEKIMGYTANGELYSEISDEVRNLPAWISQYEAELRQAGMLVDDYA